MVQQNRLSFHKSPKSDSINQPIAKRWQITEKYLCKSLHHVYTNIYTILLLYSKFCFFSTSPYPSYLSLSLYLWYVLNSSPDRIFSNNNKLILNREAIESNWNDSFCTFFCNVWLIKRPKNDRAAGFAFIRAHQYKLIKSLWSCFFFRLSFLLFTYMRKIFGFFIGKIDHFAPMFCQCFYWQNATTYTHSIHLSRLWSSLRVYICLRKGNKALGFSYLQYFIARFDKYW